MYKSALLHIYLGAMSGLKQFYTSFSFAFDREIKYEGWFEMRGMELHS